MTTTKQAFGYTSYGEVIREYVHKKGWYQAKQNLTKHKHCV